jgi:nitroimidazol reductase NimA-like FMN-containing flavoprotein (pyridoxamine 5'-phosphate oxidase superfamily)
MSNTTDNEVLTAINDTLNSNNAVILATTGSEYSPWVLGAYFTLEDKAIYLLLEKNGKTFRNIEVNKNVAFSVSENDATKDFVQAQGIAVVLPDEDERKVREMLIKKMPWYQTFVPMVPVRIDVKRYFFTSLKRGWFPAKVIELN